MNQSALHEGNARLNRSGHSHLVVTSEEDGKVASEVIKAPCEEGAIFQLSHPFQLFKEGLVPLKSLPAIHGTGLPENFVRILQLGNMRKGEFFQ